MNQKNRRKTIADGRLYENPQSAYTKKLELLLIPGVIF